MTNLTDRFKRIFQYDSLIALIILGIYFLVNGYKYAWDDQHLEIPLLKSLIDPTLYVGDYYIESLKQNFVTFFYPILARIISVQQVPAAYFILYCLSRYFLFYWLLKLWKHISGERWTAFCCVITMLVIVRVPEFLYETFSHQEFALAFVAAGLYYFYKERFVLASAILGVAVNFHALYALYPMTYMGVYLLCQVKHHRFSTLLKSSAVFLFCSMPFIIWAFQKLAGGYEHASPELYKDWMTLYKLACPQNFTFLEIPVKALSLSWRVFLIATQKYLFLLALLILNTVYNPTFRKDKKNWAIVITVWGYLVLSYYASYIHPNRFLIDLNLTRNAQYLLLFLMAYTTMLVSQTVRQSHFIVGIAITCFFLLLGWGEIVGSLAALAIGFLVGSAHGLNSDKTEAMPRWLTGTQMLGLIACVFLMIFVFLIFKYKTVILLNLVTTVILLGVVFVIFKIKPQLTEQFPGPQIFIAIPLMVMVVYFTQLHFNHLKMVKEGGGFWKLQRDWEDMQLYVKDHTPKNALLLTPTDMEMGGFRILSERKIVCCYRDCGIIGFDYKTAVEWLRRLHDVETFKVVIDNSFQPALINGLFKYHVDYVVFMKYYAPAHDSPFLNKLYENKNFSIFAVNKNALPVAQ